MPSLVRILATATVVVLISATGACGAPSTANSLVANAPDGMRIAVATAGARNVRVLHVDRGSIVRLREVFVPEGDAIAAIAWTDNGRELVVTTHRAKYAVDTQTWRIESRGDHERRLARDARPG